MPPSAADAESAGQWSNLTNVFAREHISYNPVMSFELFMFLALVAHILLYDLLRWQPYRRRFRNVMAWLIRLARRW